MNESAFQKVYQDTSKSLWSYIYSVTHDATLTDDIFQESFMKLLLANIDSLEDAQVKSYLYTITSNVLRDLWRRQKREQKWFERSAPEENAVQHTKDIHSHFDVVEAVQQLSPGSRSLLWLAYVEEYKHKEIAQMLNIKEKSVRVLLFRAKQRLLKICQQLGIEGRVNNG